MTNGLLNGNMINIKTMLKFSLLIAVLVASSVAFAQKYGKDSAQCVSNLSLYREYYKQKNYADAMAGWRYVFLNCPQASLYTFVDGAFLVSLKINASKDAVQQAYIDTLMMVYDGRIAAFGKEGYVLGRKAVDLFKYRTKNSQEVYAISKRAYELEGQKSEAAPLVTYFQSALNEMNAGRITKDEAIDVYNKVSTTCEKNIADNVKETEYYRQASGNIENIFVNSSLASCEALTASFKDKFKANPNDVELLRKITNLMGKINCTDEALFLEAATALFKIEPDAKAAVNIGRMNLKKKNYREAISFYKQAIEGETDQLAKATYYYELAACYQGDGDYSSARSNAQKAIDLNAGFGKAYLLIGDLYLSSSSKCANDENPIASKAVFWAATDVYQKAKSIDPSVAEDANSRISKCVAQYPNKSDAFFYNLKDGDSFKVECWIGINTTVRTNN
jgi:tetratricopeptide (TPR) repeat protein